VLAALDGIKHTEASIPNVLHAYTQVKLESLGHKLSEAIQAGRNDEVPELIDAYQKYSNGGFDEEEKRVYTRHSVEAIVNATTGHALIPIFPQSFADQLDGGVVKGSHILIFGRPDSGKTMMSITNAVGLLKEGHKVLYVGNEDPDDQMMMRLICAITGKTKQEVVASPAKAEALAYQHGYENLVFAGLAPGTMAEIRRLIEHYKPDALFIDQLRNLNMFEANKVLQLEKAAQQARTRGKQYGVTVFSVTQAGDSAEGKLVLNMGDVDFSNTGIPGQMDLMIGVGVDEAARQRDQIMLSVCKNKINGNYFNQPVYLNKQASIIVE
jgi:archaellum biogenesis ATPase FlaH